MKQQTKVIAFSHIPKTAGTSFNTMLRRYFGSQLMSAKPRKEVLDATYRKKDLDNDLQIYKDLKCISGHSLKPFIDFKEHSSQLAWFSFFREPVNRLLSQYIHQQTSNIKIHKMEFSAWCRRFNRKDWQVKWIAGELDLLAAKQIINDKFLAVGVLERFTDSAIVFKRAFKLTGFNPIPPVPKMTIRNSRLKDEILKNRDQFKDLIEEQTELDCLFYDYICNNVWQSQVDRYLKKDSICEKTHSKTLQIKNQIKFELKDRLVYRPFVENHS